MEGENCRCTIFYLRRSSIHNTSSSPSLLPSAFHSRRALFSPLGSQAFGDIRGGNWVDIGNESEEQITGGGKGSKFTEGNHCLCAANGSRALSRGNAEHDFAMDTRANPLRHPPARTRRGPSIRLIYIGGCSISPPARGREKGREVVEGEEEKHRGR